ncbi:MAG: hypothetical protein ACO3D0_02510 [Ilumatobacteraceae bacterium]
MSRFRDTSEAARRAAAELRAIRSDDPAAVFAIATVRATIHTLEGTWFDPRRSPDGHDEA